MAIVKQFRGLRPQSEFASEVASPPYDVLSAIEAREIVKNKPNSFLRVNKAELEFDDSVSSYSEKVYQRGKENLQNFWKNGLLVRDENPCFYLYRLTMNGKSQTGLATLTSVAEYDNGKIKKHEHTRPEKVNDRANHILHLGAQVGPVFSTFHENAEVNAIFSKISSTQAETDFIADDGVRHEFWVIDGETQIQEIEDAFAKIPALYIADGHHRSQAASEVCQRLTAKNPNCKSDAIHNYFLNVLFSEHELDILPYNRVVRDLNGHSLDGILEQAKIDFTIEKVDSAINPENSHSFGIYCENQWFLLKSKDDSFDKNDPVGSIDAAILGANFIEPILGISDPKTDKRINFVGGIRGTAELEKLIDSGEYKIAFSLFATTISQLLNVADAGEVMPPKSTWFEPKLRSGMIVNLLEN